MELLVQSSFHQNLYMNVLEQVKEERGVDLRVITCDGEIVVNRDLFLLSSSFMRKLLCFQSDSVSTVIVPDSSCFAIQVLENYLLDYGRISFPSSIVPSDSMLGRVVEVSSLQRTKSLPWQLRNESRNFAHKRLKLKTSLKVLKFLFRGGGFMVGF